MILASIAASAELALGGGETLDGGIVQLVTGAAYLSASVR